MYSVDVFELVNGLKIDENGKDIPSVKYKKVDLFSLYNQVSLEQVKLNSWLLQSRGNDYHVQDLEWTKKKLFVFMDKELYKKLLERIGEFPELEQTGPISFKIGMDLILFSNSKLSDLQGENIFWRKNPVLICRNINIVFFWKNK